MIHTLLLMAASLNPSPSPSTSPSTPPAKDAQMLQYIADGVDGRVGICVMDLKANAPSCLRAQESFPLQSVMKLVVSAAVLDRIDQKKLKLDDNLTVKPDQASPGPQEFADLIKKKGSLTVTIEELIRRSIVDSDSTSIDVLIAEIGGIPSIQEFLQRKKIDGIRIDRNERDLQAEFSGLAWKAEFADEKRFDAAVKALSDKDRDQALTVYSQDQRDTATPLGMVHFLKALYDGTLLSKSSTATLLSIMAKTETGKDRLKAGVPKGWTLAHKTGTSATWKGISAATNDVGLALSPEGKAIAIVVFVANSKAPAAARAAVIANTAKLATSPKIEPRNK